MSGRRHAPTVGAVHGLCHVTVSSAIHRRIRYRSIRLQATLLSLSIGRVPMGRWCTGLILLIASLRSSWRHEMCPHLRHSLRGSVNPNPGPLHPRGDWCRAPDLRRRIGTGRRPWILGGSRHQTPRRPRDSRGPSGARRSRGTLRLVCSQLDITISQLPWWVTGWGS